MQYSFIVFINSAKIVQIESINKLMITYRYNKNTIFAASKELPLHSESEILINKI